MTGRALDAIDLPEFLWIPEGERSEMLGGHPRGSAHLLIFRFRKGILVLILMLLIGTAMAIGGWWSYRFAWWRPTVSWDRPRVLMYHMISLPRPGARFNKLRVHPVEFERQLHWLQLNGFQFIFASQLFSSDPLPERAVCLTFDDGYLDNLETADPLLKHYQACATLYLVTDRSGGWSSQKKAHHADEELACEPKLSDDQVALMVASRRWELGGHTRTHVNLTKADPSEALEQIGESRTAFLDRFQVIPPTFAYPFGLYHAEHIDLVRQTGFLGAMTTEPGIAPRPCTAPHEVPRIKVSGHDTLFAFRQRMRTGRRGAFQ